MRFAFDYMQRDGESAAAATWLRDKRGGSVYLRLSTRPLEQPPRAMTRGSRRATSSTAPTGCASRGRTPNVVIAYTGAVAPEAIEATGLIAEDRRDIGLLAVTSADRLNAGWIGGRSARASAARPTP